MKKLVALIVFVLAIGFTNGNAASQQGADCDALFDSTNQWLKDLGHTDQQALNGASGVFWSCINTGGNSNRIVYL